MSAVLTAAGEARVNTTTANSQEFPAITTLAGGGYVVTWMSLNQDGSSYGIYAQRYGADGTPLGGEARVNTTTANDQAQPAITALDDGGYVVTWMSLNQDGSSYGIYAQRYGADGTPLGGEARVNTTTANDQAQPAITALDDGGYVVTWMSLNQDGSGWGIYAQRYSADGTALGGEVRVNTTTTDSQERPAITALADGGYVVTWMSLSQDGSGWGIYAQRYSADGTALGGEVRVNTTTVDNQLYPAITALADGGFAVTWMSASQDGSSYGVYAQRYSADGTALGGETRVNTTTANNQDFPAITALAGGGYVVTWMSANQDGSGYGIYAQRYSADGTALGGEVRVNTTTVDNQLYPAITALADGGFTVTWMSASQDGSSYGVYSRTFASSDFASFTSAVELVTGTSGDDTYTVSNAAFLVGDDLEGGEGTDTLQLNAGLSLDLTSMNGLSGVERIVGGAGDEVLVVSDTRLAEVTSIDLQAGTDTLQASELTLDLTGKTLTGVERVVAGRAEGLTLTVDSFSTALLMEAADRTITIIDATRAFTAAQRQQLFANGVEAVVQGSRTYYADGTALEEGPEVRVNTTTAEHQMYPAITALAGGGYVVTWMSWFQDGSGYGIYAQRYSADGTALGGEVRVNTTTANDQYYPTIVALADGGYVVTWMSFNQDGSSYDVYAQRFDADGGVLGGEVRVNTTTANDQAQPKITALADGGYVVTWMSWFQDGSSYGIYAQRYGADGTPLGGEVRVNTTTANDQTQPAITALDDGGYVVTWMSLNQDGSGYGIYAQRYSADGTALGGEVRVNTTTANSQERPTITALDDGGYVVTWMSWNQDGSGSGVYAQRYSADGTALGGEVRVNTTTVDNQLYPAITTLADGGYVVTWMSLNQDGSGYGIYAQRYSADGTALGGEVRVNTTTANDQYYPTIVALADGGFAVTWMSFNQDGSSWGIYSKVYSGALANRAPIADAGGPYEIDEGEAVLLDARASYDPDAADTIVSYAWDLTGDGVFDATSLTPELTLSAAQIEALGLNPGAYTILVRVTDSAGSTHDDTATLTITNVNDAPVVVSAIADQSTDEDAPYSYNAAQHFADADVIHGDVLSYSATGLPAWLSINAATGLITGTPANEDVGSYTITVTAYDGEANASSAFVLTVGGTNDLPVVSTELADQAASEDEPFSFTFPEDVFTDADGDALTCTAALANGDPLPVWLAFDPATRTFSGTPSQTDTGVLSITVTASDGTGSVSDTFVLDVGGTNDTPVVTTEIPDVSTTEDAVYTLDAAAHFSDPDGDSLTYSATGLPAWLSIDAATGQVTGTPTNADVGQHTITIIASDAEGSTSSEFILTVTNTNDGPVVTTAIGDQAIGEDAPYSYDAAQHFTDDDLAYGDSLTYSASGLPAWLSIDAATGQLTGTPANGDVGASAITVTATDEAGVSIASSFALTIDNVNDAPVLVTELADQSAREDAPFTFTFPQDAFSDADGDTLTYAATLANGDPLPDWLSFDPLTRTFSGTPAQADVGTFSITVTASDGTESVSDTFDLAVGGINDAPEVVTPIAASATAEDAAYSYDASTHFSDPDGDTLTYTATGPSWLSIDPATGVLSGTPANGDVGEHQVTVVAEDPTGAEISTSFTLTVTNTNDGPVVTTAIGDQSTNEDALYSYNAAQHFADDDLIYGDRLTYNATGLPSWLSIDEVTGQITGTPSDGDVGAYTITVTASDGEASASSTFVLTVGGTNDAPIVATELADQSASEDVPFTFTFPQDAFSDADGDALTYTASLESGDPLPDWLSFDQQTRTFSGTPAQADAGILSITVTASDGTESVSDAFALTVGGTNDTPMVTGEIPDASTAEDAAYSYDASTHFSDPDGDALTYTISGPAWLSIDSATGQLTGTPTNADVGSSTITITASDAQGSALSEFVLTVTNTNDGPVVTTEIADQSTDEDAPYSYNVAQHFADADVIHGDVLSYSATGLPAWLTLNTATGQLTGTPAQADVGSYTILVTASDGEATASSEFVLTVDDVPDETVTMTVTFRDGLGGYAGTIDTMIRQNSPTSRAGTATTIGVDTGTNAEQQALLAFTNLFGTGPGQIPLDAVITAASLTLRTTNGSAQGGTLHRMNTGWDETATWNSLGNGVQIGSQAGSEAELAADVTTGRTVNGSRSFDVTESVKAWAAGEDNFGWVFKAGGTDGWDFSSSENSATSRPVLNVTYTTGPSGPSKPVVSIVAGTPNPQTEGQGAQISFTLTLDKASDQPVTVTYSTEDGTAQAGSDFTGVTSGSVTFEPNQTSATVTIDLINDLTPEAAESFRVKLNTATNATVSATSHTATGNIADNDTPTTVTFRDGLGGYAGTIDTMIRQNSPTSRAGTATTIGVDTGTNAEQQALLAFTNLFGTGPGQIPLDAVITAASLTLRTTNGSAQGGTLHRMNTGWDETATWNSLGNGVQIGSQAGSEAELAADVTTGRTVNGSRSFDVTESVKAWAAGEDNFGWVFKAGGTDGWDFSSSENSATSRPTLTVTYRVPEPTSSLTAQSGEITFAAMNSNVASVAGPDGSQTFTGTLGDDAFIFSQGDDRDTIVGFVAGEAPEDRIDLRGIGAEFSFEQLQDRFVQDGADTVIDFGNGDVLRLAGVQASKLVAGDFLL